MSEPGGGLKTAAKTRKEEMKKQDGAIKVKFIHAETVFRYPKVSLFMRIIKKLKIVFGKKKSPFVKLERRKSIRSMD